MFLRGEAMSQVQVTVTKRWCVIAQRPKDWEREEKQTSHPGFSPLTEGFRSLTTSVGRELKQKTNTNKNRTQVS